MKFLTKNKKTADKEIAAGRDDENRKFRIRQKMIWTRKALQMAGIMSLK